MQSSSKPLIGVHRSIKSSRKFPWETCTQVCLTSSHNWNIGKGILPDDLAGCRVLFVHGKFIYNFCRPDSQDQQETLLSELKLANKYGADLVIHQGKNLPGLHADRLLAVECYAQQINKVLDKASASGLGNRLLLENSARQGNEIGYSLNELALIWDYIIDKKRAGICIDTCHLFAAGELDLRDADKVAEWLTKFNKVIGWDHLHLVHFNDSRKDFGCRVDRHENLFCGYITNPKLGGSLDGMRYLADFCIQRDIPIIMETPGADNAWDQCARWLLKKTQSK